MQCAMYTSHCLFSERKIETKSDHDVFSTFPFTLIELEIRDYEHEITLNVIRDETV